MTAERKLAALRLMETLVNSYETGEEDAEFLEAAADALTLMGKAIKETEMTIEISSLTADLKQLRPDLDRKFIKEIATREVKKTFA
jgi:uncharacterized protein YPO0396